MNGLKIFLLLGGMLFTFSSCEQTANEEALDATEKKALVSTFIQLMENKAFDRFGEVIAEDYRQHSPLVEQGLEGIRAGASWFLTVFPALSANIESGAVKDELVGARFTWTGTHSAELFDIPASGINATWTGADWWRVENGKFVEHWDVVD